MVANYIHLFIYMIVVRRLGLKCLKIRHSRGYPAVVVRTFENGQELLYLVVVVVVVVMVLALL